MFGVHSIEYDGLTSFFYRLPHWRMNLIDRVIELAIIITCIMLLAIA